jgi:hypothetical protein
MANKSLIPRKFRIGQWVITKSGLRGKVIGSALYGFVAGKPTRNAHVEYRIKVPGKAKTMYRREDELRKG